MTYKGWSRLFDYNVELYGFVYKNMNRNNAFVNMFIPHNVIWHIEVEDSYLMHQGE